MKLSILEKSLIGLGFMLFFGLFLLSIFVDPSANGWAPKCFLYSKTGIECPLCGGQRSIFHLFKGNIKEAWRFNHLPLLVLCGIPLYLTSKYVLKWSLPSWLDKNKWYVLVVYLIGFFILRNIF